MLYPDSERRIDEMTRLAELFKSKGYPETAKEIFATSQILRGDRVPADFLNKLDSLFSIHHREFEAELTVGMNYRKRCFEEIATIVFKAIGRLGPDFPKVLLNVHPILTQLGDAKKTIGSLADELARNTINDRNIIFHLHCYSYLILVEGVFDELARILFFLRVVESTNVPKPGDLEKMTVWDILRGLKATPVFLERWEDKKHVRNAIGHARASYDTTTGKARFIDVNEQGKVWDSGNVPFSNFAEMALELEDSLTAFLNIFLLLKIYDLIMSTTPYEQQD